MAEKKQPHDVAVEEAERQRQAAAPRRLDEAERPGGRYIVGGVAVDANGQPIEE